MKAVTLLASICLLSSMALAPIAAHAARDKPMAESIRTVWVGGKGRS